MSALATVYCTDEDIALRATVDYVNIVPRWQKLASGTDGAFALSTGAWTLASATVNFADVGLQPGHVVALTGPRSLFPGLGELFAVDSVGAGGSVTLRRCGQVAGIGQPPGGTFPTGVSFAVYTFGPQIDIASYDANKFFGIDPNFNDRKPGNLYDTRELQQFVVLSVLRRAYIAVDKETTGDYERKLGLVTQELNDLQSRLTVHWGSLQQLDTPNNLFSARLRR